MVMHSFQLLGKNYLLFMLMNYAIFTIYIVYIYIILYIKVVFIAI